MNYLTQLNTFYRILPNNSLSANAQCLYMYLLNKDNELGWLNEFTVPNSIVIGFTSLSKKSLERARNELISKGYIQYKKGLSNKAGKYLIINLEGQNSIQNVAHNDPHDDPHGDPHDDPHDDPHRGAHGDPIK